MDKMALADRFDGYSNVFASDSNIGIDLKAMADTLRSMPEEKFAKVINADFEEEAFLTPGQSGPSALERRTPLSERPHMVADSPKVKQIADKYKLSPDQIHELFIDLETLKGPNPKPSFKEAFLTTGPGGTGSRERVPLSERPHMVADSPKVKQIADKYKLSPDQIHELFIDLETLKGPNPKPSFKQAGDTWTKSASDLIAQNLVRDVLGMDKSICCDTKRHLDKKQMPDATKTQETKGAVARQEDTGAALKPEQVPHLDEVLNSDMYKKSQGKVVKEAATTEDKPDTRAAEPQEINADETADDVAKRLKKIEDEKKKADLKAKSRPESKEKEAQPEVEANTVVAEGVEFDNVMMEAEANDEDVKKLSALFE